VPSKVGKAQHAFQLTASAGFQTKREKKRGKKKRKGKTNSNLALAKLGLLPLHPPTNLARFCWLQLLKCLIGTLSRRIGFFDGNKPVASWPSSSPQLGPGPRPSSTSTQNTRYWQERTARSRLDRRGCFISGPTSNSSASCLSAIARVSSPPAPGYAHFAQLPCHEAVRAHLRSTDSISDIYRGKNPVSPTTLGGHD